MKNNGFIQLVAAFSLLLLTGCSAMQDLTVDDLKQPENLRREKAFSQTIAQIRKSIFDYSSKCDLQKNIYVDPGNTNFGTISFEGMGLTRNNISVLIEFNQTQIGTEAKGYSYNETSASYFIDRIFKVIEFPEKCQ